MRILLAVLIAVTPTVVKGDTIERVTSIYVEGCKVEQIFWRDIITPVWCDGLASSGKDRLEVFSIACRHIKSFYGKEEGVVHLFCGDEE